MQQRPGSGWQKHNDCNGNYQQHLTFFELFTDSVSQVHWFSKVLSLNYTFLSAVDFIIVLYKTTKWICLNGCDIHSSLGDRNNASTKLKLKCGLMCLLARGAMVVMMIIEVKKYNISLIITTHHFRLFLSKHFSQFWHNIRMDLNKLSKTSQAGLDPTVCHMNKCYVNQLITILIFQGTQFSRWRKNGFVNKLKEGAKEWCKM